MDAKLIAAVAIVAAVAVVGGGAAVMFNGDDGNPGNYEKIDTAGTQGTVFGNANGDCRIDNDDLLLIQKIIDDNDPEDLKKFPLADVNHDGAIDGKDLELTKAIVNKTAETVDVLDYLGRVVSVSYPIKDVFCAGGTNMRIVISVLGLEKYMNAVATNQYISEALDYNLVEKVKSGDVVQVSTNATTSDITALTKAELKIALVECAGTNQYDQKKALNFYGDKKMDYLIFNTNNYEYVMNTITTIGILVGEEANAEKYLKFITDIDNTMTEALKAVNDSNRKTVMTIVMANSVNGSDSDYFKSSERAGGKNLGDFAEKTKKYDPSSGDYWLLDPKYNPDLLFHFKSMTYGEAPNPEDIKTYKGYFDETNAYQEGHYYLFNGVIPLPIRNAYMSEIMYPELYEKGWADSLFQAFIDEFTALKDWDVSEHKILWSVSDF